MPTFTALTTLENAPDARALAEALEGLSPEPAGVGVFELEDGSGHWEVGAYFETPPSEAELAVLSAAFRARPFAVSELPVTDWVAHVKRELSPVDAGRFFLYGSHDTHRVPEGRIALLIEAAMAFGTGHHGTTLGCLRALSALADDRFAPARIADIGCGTAVLAMAAARLWEAADVWAADIDPVAVDVAQANLSANGLDGRIKTVECPGFDAAKLRSAGPFDLVFANILKGPLIELAPDLAANAAPGGRVILSGLLKSQAESVKSTYASVGFNTLDEAAIVDWTTLVLAKSAL